MRRISPATVTVGVLALVVGLVAAFVVRQSMLPKPVVQQPVPPKPTVPVVVARVNLPINSMIRDSDLQTLNVPADREIKEGFLKRANVAVGRVVKQTMKAGQIVREEYLLNIGESLPSVAERIPAGHRAMTIIVNKTNSGGQLIDAGAHVDIAMSVEGTHPDLGELATRTVLRGVEVVEVDRADRRRGDGNVALTVAVTPQDANKLITAQASGLLNVTLCSAADGDKPLVQGDADAITRKQLLGLRELPQPVEPTPVDPPQPFRVEQWKAGRLQVIELGQDQIQESQRNAGGANTASTAPVSTPAGG